MLRRVVLRSFLLFCVALELVSMNSALGQDVDSLDYGQPKPAVLIIPFDIYSSQDQARLQTQILDMLVRELEKEGVTVLEMPATAETGIEEQAHWTTTERMRRLGHRVQAQYVIRGSLTQVGKRISLDARMLETETDFSPAVFYAEGEGLESLQATVNELSIDLSMQLFNREKIDKILIEGNQRIEADAISRVIQTKTGNQYRPRQLSDDLKAVYKMGYFEDVRIESEKGTKGRVVIFKVQEKPTLRRIHLKGNRIFEDEEIQENLTLDTGSILNDIKIKNNVKRIEDLYKDKNYHNVKVTYTVGTLEKNQTDLEFVITEGEKVRIEQIAFEGNGAYSDKELKKILKTSEQGMFSWLTASGELDMEDLSQDVFRISAFYHNHGFIEAKVGEPQVDFREDGIFIKIKIDEGPQFRIGKVEISGDLIQPKEELLTKIKITAENMYNRKVIRNDVLTLKDIYSDEGYANADIFPRIDKNLDTKEVDIDFIVNKGQLVYFDKIIISGNTKTRDKVIRRQLKVYEQELYSGRLVKRSTRNLLRLDYFEDVKVNTLPGDSDDKVDLKIDVTEKPTGTFSFGGGYSSVESFFVMASISQRNLFGRGQILSLHGQLGGETTDYTVSFTEPWLFDIPLSAGFDLFNWEKDYDDYDKDSYGGKIRFGYPVYDYTRANIAYLYESADIDNIEDDASNSIKELEGTNVTSSLTAALKYDSRDRTFNPTRGGQHSISVEYAGGFLGGDVAFNKYQAESGYYFPLFWGTVGFVRGKGGYVQRNSDGILPDYEKFYLGGINSIRGYDWRDICAKDDEGDDIGGTKFVQFNFEFIFPLIKEAGLKGLVFFDTGDVYDDGEDIDFGSLRQSVGYGFRWNSPVGPIRLEYGYILDDEDEEYDGGRWEFSMGSSF